MVNLDRPNNWNFSERLLTHFNGIYDHADLFAGRQLELFNPEIGINDLVGKAFTFRYSWDKEEEIQLLLEHFLQDSKISQVEALTFGMLKEVFETEHSQYLVDYLVEAKDKLTNLKAIFIGDITQDESEISWISHDNISPILTAYPNLEVLQIRGGEGLKFSPAQHNNLQALIIETGGLSKDTIADISKLQLPNLQHLELWLGSDYYGGNSTVEDLNWILSGNVSEKLIYLGLRNSEYSDDIATAITKSTILERIKILDLSMGTLTDEGATTLLKSSAINNLDILNISENYLSQNAIDSLQQLNIQVIADKQKEEYDEEERYCSVSE